MVGQQVAFIIYTGAIVSEQVASFCNYKMEVLGGDPAPAGADIAVIGLVVVAWEFVTNLIGEFQRMLCPETQLTRVGCVLYRILHSCAFGCSYSVPSIGSPTGNSTAIGR